MSLLPRVRLSKRQPLDPSRFTIRSGLYLPIWIEDQIQFRHMDRRQSVSFSNAFHKELVARSVIHWYAHDSSYLYGLALLIQHGPASLPIGMK